MCIPFCCASLRAWGGWACERLSPCASSWWAQQVFKGRWLLPAAISEMTPLSVLFHRHTLEMDPKDVRLTGKRNRSQLSPSLSPWLPRPSSSCSPVVPAFTFFSSLWSLQCPCWLRSWWSIFSSLLRRWMCHPTGPGKATLAVMWSSHTPLGDTFYAGGGGGCLLIYFFSIFPSSFSISYLSFLPKPLKLSSSSPERASSCGVGNNSWRAVLSTVWSQGWGEIHCPAERSKPNTDTQPRTWAGQHLWTCAPMLSFFSFFFHGFFFFLNSDSVQVYFWAW